MSFETQKNRFLALDAWFQTPQGMHIEKAFSEEFAPLKSFLRGDNLLQLGSFADNAWLKLINYSFKRCATPVFKEGSPASFLTAFNQLPVARNSIDCIVAPFTFELLSGLKTAIDEIDRILKPTGFVVFLGTNPLSFWGILMRLGHLPGLGKMAGRPQSALVIKRAMYRRGYRHCSFSSFYFIPPLKQEKWLKRLEVLNTLGKIIWPCPAAFYCLVMQKYQCADSDLFIDTVEEKLQRTQVLPLQPVGYKQV